jgi:hypothetical protein
MRNPVGMHEAGLSKFTHYLRGKLSAASKENLKQALDTPPGDKGGIDLWTLPKNQLFESGNEHFYQQSSPLLFAIAFVGTYLATVC